MKRILILIIGLIGVAYGQYAPTSAKTKFVNGLSIGSKDSTYFANAGDTVILYIGRDSAVYTKFRGSHRKLAFDGSLSAYKLISDSLFANGYTTRARTKQLSDSLAAVKLNISDTASMLSGYKTYYPRTAISAGTGISYNAATGVITNSSPSSGGTVTSVATNNGSGITGGTITTTGTIAADTTVLATRAYAAGLDVAKANTSLNNVNGVLSSTYGGAGSVSGILKANGSGVVSAAVAGDITSLISGTYLPLSGGTLTGALNGTSLSMSGAGSFGGDVGIGTASPSGIGRVINGYGGTGINSNLVLEGNAGASFISILSSATVGVGSSIFAKEGIRFAKATAKDATGFTEQMRLETDGALLINTTTTDGVHKLIVNGGVKGGDINITGTSNLIGNVTIGTTATPADAVLNLASNASGTPRSIIYSQSTAFLNFTSTTGANVFQISNGGAITASSSVTANSFVKSGGASTEALMANGSVQTVSSSTYTPTLTGTTNITSVTLDKASYIRVGNFVTVTVYGTVQTTASGASDFTISLPFTAGGTAPMSGSGTVANLGIDSRAMFAQSSSLTAIKYYWDSPNTTLKTFSVTFQFGL